MLKIIQNTSTTTGKQKLAFVSKTSYNTTVTPYICTMIQNDKVGISLISQNMTIQIHINKKRGTGIIIMCTQGYTQT